MKYDPDDYTGSIEITDRSPVPFSARVRRRRKSDGLIAPVPAAEFLSEISDWLAKKKPKRTLLGMEGPLFFYH